MFEIDRHIVTGLGTRPTELGISCPSLNMNLLNMSGYSIDDISRTTKIADLRFVNSNLRLAMAEYGKFQSLSMLVVDFDVISDKALPVLGVYNLTGISPTEDCLPYRSVPFCIIKYDQLYSFMT
jgi:hypothetical protein